jgi:ribonucleotide reductase beta subunit family protein with ferritin-like domain
MLEVIESNNKKLNKTLLFEETVDDLSIDKLKQFASDTVNDDIIKELQAIDTSDEPLIQNNPDIYNLNELSPKDQEELALYKIHQKAYWPAEEVSMVDDIKQWGNLLYDQTSPTLTELEKKSNTDKNDKARHFTKRTLAFFASADGIVNANIGRLVNEITNPYVKLYYTFQMMMEGIHTEAYAIMLKTLVPDTKELSELFRAIYKIPVIRKKAIFAMKYLEHPDPKHYLNSKNSLALRIVASAVTELVQFSDSFAAIYWLRTKGVMPGLSEFNKQIARDEGLHGEHHCKLYNREIKHRLPPAVVYRILNEAYAFEREFFYEALPCALIGINADQMDLYVRMVVIRTSEMLEYMPMFKPVTNPFTWMDKINLNNKNNLHEIASGDYQNAMIETALNWGCNMNF